MKTAYVVLAGALMGVMLGTGITLASYLHSPAQLSPRSAQAPALAAPGVNQPRALVDRSFHDFGPVDRDRKVSHVFRVTNMGKSTLTLKSGGTTCSKCTIAELTRSDVEPGETVDVTVEYQPNVRQPRFRQTATLLTNDPDQPRIELSIFGTVTAQYTVTPDMLVLSRFSSTTGTKAEVKILAFVSDSVSMARYQLEEPETAEYFEVKSEPLPRQQWTDPKARSGLLLSVTVKPGLPLGPVRQTIRLDLALAGVTANPTIEIPIEGTVDADISLAGHGWIQDQNLLKFGPVKHGQGAVRDLFLLVRGEHRQGLQVTPAAVVPNWVKVTVGEPTDLAGGTVTKIPLKVEIPPDAPVANHSGTDLGKLGEVILETSHPVVKRIRMNLNFTIEQ